MAGGGGARRQVVSRSAARAGVVPRRLTTATAYRRARTRRPRLARSRRFDSGTRRHATTHRRGTMTDPTITIAGLRARINSLLSAVQHSNRTTAERVTMFVEASSNADRLTAERDALAAQLAEVRAELVQLGGADLARDAAEDRAARLDADLAKVRAELAAAPKVCAIHSYALEGPCMTCGAPWPGAEKALRQERIEGMEKMLRISRAVGCPNSVEEVVEAVAAIKADLASERARLAACQTRITGLEQAANERSAEVARLTARVAELEARPVLTQDAP